MPPGRARNAIALVAAVAALLVAGWWLNLLGIVLIPLATYTLGIWVFGIK